MKRNQNKLIIICTIFIFLIILVLVFYRKQVQGNLEKLDMKGVSNNLVSNNEMVQFLYERYHLEDNLKFRIAGSDTTKQYAFYYKKNKVTFDDFSSIYKSYILLDLINHQDNYEEERKCYRYPLEEFKKAYEKYYGRIDDFYIDTNEEYEPHFYLDEDSICISEEDDYQNNYNKTVDTYMVNGIYQENKIIIYERVAFVKVKEDVLEFYKDYDMKKKEYTLEIKDTNLEFMNNSKMVSNVLINYQDEFPMYQYTYVKGDNTYYLESIEYSH